MLYFFSAGRSALLKKARGCHVSLTSCLSTAPTAIPEVSTGTAKGALAWGYVSRVALAKASFVRLNAEMLSSVHCSSLDFPAIAWYKVVIEIHHTKELLESFDCGGFGELLDSCYLGG